MLESEQPHEILLKKLITSINYYLIVLIKENTTRKLIMKIGGFDENKPLLHLQLCMCS